MEEMRYEFLMRRVYNCERDYSKGADADIYRDMLHAHTDLETKSMFATQSEREYQYAKTFAAVSMNVRTALDTAKTKVGKVDAEKLATLSAKLTIDLDSKEELDLIIREANTILKANNMDIG